MISKSTHPLLRLAALAILTLSLAACDQPDKDVERCKLILDQAAPDVSVSITPVGLASTGEEGKWYDYRIKLTNGSKYIISWDKVTVTLPAYLRERNPEQYTYQIETRIESQPGAKRVYWRNASMGLSGSPSVRVQIPPKDSVEFRAAVRTEYQGQPLPGTQIRAAIYIYAEAGDRNGRLIPSNPIPFPSP